MVALVATLLPGFHIFGGFWSAFGTALIVGVTGWIGSWLTGRENDIQINVRTVRDKRP
jgi:hypothetical protein